MGLNTRKLLPGAMLVPGASQMVLANRRMAFHTDGLSAVDSATLCQGFWMPTSGKGPKRAEKTCVCTELCSASCPCDSSTLSQSPPNFKWGRQRLYKRPKTHCKYLMDLDPRVMQSGPWKLGGLSTFTDECHVKLFLPR